MIQLDKPDIPRPWDLDDDDEEEDIDFLPLFVFRPWRYLNQEAN